jgi:hypothetical protein
MKRLAFAFLLLAPVAAYAFDRTPPTPLVGVLRQSGDVVDPIVSDAVLRYVTEELRGRGLDAFDAGVTYDEALDDGFAEADYLVEIAAMGDRADQGGIGVGGRHLGLGLWMSVARVAAEVRVYDGQTFELIASDRLQHRNRAVLPTSISLGGRAAWLSLAVPIAHTAQIRHVARAAARDAATRVTAAIAGQ